jgi:hypothetical protein
MPNKYTEKLLQEAVTNYSQIFDLFGSNHLAALNNFENVCLSSLGQWKKDPYGFVHTYKCFLAAMSEKELKAYMAEFNAGLTN